MFRSINKTVERKIKNISTTADETEKINRVFARFLDKSFPEGKNFVYEIRPRLSNGEVIITAPNKLIANELILKMGELSRFLKEEGFNVNEVIVN